MSKSKKNNTNTNPNNKQIGSNESQLNLNSFFGSLLGLASIYGSKPRNLCVLKGAAKYYA